MAEGTGLPPIDQSLLPASVRAGGQRAVRLYDSALSFEGLLDQQLAQALTDTMQPTDSDDDSDDGGGGDASSSVVTQLLPQALSQGIVADGGLGLASQLYQSLSATTASTGEGAQ